AKHERRLALATVVEDWRASPQLESISSDLVAALIKARDKSLETLLAHLLAFRPLYEQHQDDQAAQLLETCLECSGFAPTSIREMLIVNAGIFQAGRRKRVDLARQWLADLPPNPKANHRRFMVEGAILEAQENFIAALEKVDEIEKTILAATEPGKQQL